MTSRTRLLFHITFFVSILLSLLLLVLSLADPKGRLRDNGSLFSISVAGEYSVDGGAFRPLAVNMDIPQNARVVVVRGRLTEPIQRNQILLMRIEDLRVRLDVNGETAFAFGERGTYPTFIESPGNVWQSYTSAGITREDEVTFTLEAVYENDFPEGVNDFLNRLQVGSERHLYTDMIGQNRVAMLIGMMLLTLGAVLLLATMMGLCFKLPFVNAAALFSGIMLSGGAWLLTNYDCLSLLLPYPAFNNLAGQVNMYLLPVFSAMFVRSFIKSRLRLALDVDAWICAAFLVIGCLLQLLGVMDLHKIQTVGNVPVLLTVVACILCLWYESRQPEGRAAYYTLLSILPLGVGASVDIFNYYFRFTEWNQATPIGFLFFAVMQVAILFNGIQQNAKKSLQLQNDLLQSRVAMMLSQIQPHFLYNALTAIKQLCLDDPVKAEQAIGDFSGYLRANLDSLSKKASIPLLQELEHVERYIRLEQMRFGDRVKIRYDLRYSTFAVPTLTVQPLVENAVRYGITKKPEGGTVTVYADETDADFIVRVSDDGVGFDPAAKLSEDRSHIGLDNVKSRVAALCDGVVTVESAIGKGTAVTIRIPKKEADVS